MSKASQSKNDAIDNAITAQNADQLRAAILAKAPASNQTLARAMATGNREIARLAIIAVTQDHAIPSREDTLRIRAFIASGELAEAHPLRAPLEQIFWKGAASLSRDPLILFNEYANNAQQQESLPASAQRFLTHHAEEVTTASAHHVSLKRILIQKTYPKSLPGKLADKIGEYLALSDFAPLVSNPSNKPSSYQQMVTRSRAASDGITTNSLHK